MGYRRDMWEIAASHNGVLTISQAEDAAVPAVEVRKLAARGALDAHGHGVYTHRDVPDTPFTQPTIAVALAGDSAFLQRESVLDLMNVGQFNPRRILVATRRRVRRQLPEWMALELRRDVPDGDLTSYEGILSTTAYRALEDMRERMPHHRWEALVEQCERRDLITESEAVAVKEGSACQVHLHR